MLDLALWLMGSPKATRVSGVVYDRLAKEMEPLLGPLDIEDLGAAMIHLDNGAAIYLETSWGGYIEREHVFTELLGTRGGAKYERWGREAPTDAARAALPTLHDHRATSRSTPSRRTSS